MSRRLAAALVLIVPTIVGPARVLAQGRPGAVASPVADSVEAAARRLPERPRGETPVAVDDSVMRHQAMGDAAAFARYVAPLAWSDHGGVRRERPALLEAVARQRARFATAVTTVDRVVEVRGAQAVVRFRVPVGGIAPDSAPAHWGYVRWYTLVDGRWYLDSTRVRIVERGAP